MNRYHPIYRIVEVHSSHPYVIRVRFSDETEKRIDLEPLLHGEMFGPLRDKTLFQSVQVNPEVGTIEWPNGADLDPTTIYHWDEHVQELTRRAKEWIM